MIFQDLDRIVFAGDSVTDMGSVNPVGEGLYDNLGHSYVRVIENLLSAVYPEIRIRITNSGISGNTSRDLLARWERDVRQLNPQWVSILIGFNDVWRQFDSRLCGEKTTLRTVVQCDAGITPAYAGKSFKGECSGSDKRDHPRLCGEKR